MAKAKASSSSSARGAREKAAPRRARGSGSGRGRRKPASSSGSADQPEKRARAVIDVEAHEPAFATEDDQYVDDEDYEDDRPLVPSADEGASTADTDINEAVVAEQLCRWTESLGEMQTVAHAWFLCLQQWKFTRTLLVDLEEWQMEVTTWLSTAGVPTEGDCEAYLQASRAIVLNFEQKWADLRKVVEQFSIAEEDQQRERAEAQAQRAERSTQSSEPE